MTKKKEEKNIKNIVEETVTQLLGKLEVEGKVSVVEKEAGAKAGDKLKQFQVDIETSESGLLIGYHGETINSLQLLLGIILYKKLGSWIRVILDVGDYRKMREDSIKEMVNRITVEVLETGRPVELPYLSPLERRIVHIITSENEKVVSESHGEGKDRRVMIKPR